MTEPSPLAVFDFLTHSRVRIAADAASIWSFIADSGSWQGAQALVRVDGEPGRVGERFHAVDTDAPDTPLFFVENVELVPAERRTIRLNGLDGALMGFATWTLAPEGDQTVVAYDVYCRYAGLPQGASQAEVLASANLRMDEGLLRLKGLVEAAGARA
jgi:hypothetical protein